MSFNQESTQPISSTQINRVAEQSRRERQLGLPLLVTPTRRQQPQDSNNKGGEGEEEKEHDDDDDDDDGENHKTEEKSGEKDDKKEVNRKDEQRLAVVAGTQHQISTEELSKTLTKASLTCLPETRLILAHPSWTSIQDSAAVRLPRKVGSWDMVSVVQRTHDVRFALCLPFHDPPTNSPNQSLVARELRCEVFYDPASENCVLRNTGGTDREFYLTDLSPQRRRLAVRVGQSTVLRPGLWRISIKSTVVPEIHLIDVLILRRKFAVTIQEPNRMISALPSGKRKATELSSSTVAKRRKQDKHQEDVDAIEIILAPAVESNITSLDVTPFRQVIPTSSTPLMDLKDGNIAVVRSTRSEIDTQSTRTNDYELRRLEPIAETASASVFTVRHSALSDNVVAKVMKYRGVDGHNLIQCARGWEREWTFLRGLSHANIMSLKAFDGRLFALYVELLPRSLDHGPYCDLSSADALTILHDMSSALVYLETRQVTHNDIKPCNIAYSPERGAVLLDFGLAGYIGDPMSPAGTPWYIPPEFKTEATRSAAGDVWALGITMLYVQRKTRLPERASPGWLIRDANVEKSEAGRRMNAWLGKVEAMRVELDQADRLEGLVYRMLNQEPELRIRATQLLASLEASS